jgi:hypothetical protein
MVSRGGYDRDNITVFDKKGAAECPLEDGSWTKSYRVTVECNNINDILNPEFWPDGIGCRRFWRKKVTDN